MSIQFYLRKVHLQIYLWKKKGLLQIFFKKMIFQNFSLNKEICLTFIKKRNLPFILKKKIFFIRLSKNKI